MASAYPVVLAVAVSTGLLWLGFTHRGTSPESSIDLGLAALFAGLIGARIGHVAAYWSYYSTRLTEAAQFWQGGLSWAGAAVGVLIGAALYTAATGLPFWSQADALAAPALLVGAAGWLGCLLDACAYGQPIPNGPMMPDLLGVEAARWPTQAIGGVLTLLALAGVFRLAEAELPTGTVAMAALSALAAINLAVALIRGDPVPVVGGLRLDGLASAVLLGMGAIGLAVRR